MITGIDIVKEMIKVSYGNPLSFKQSDISIKGHAIECRICAEDPDNNFLPTPGTVVYVKSPQGPGVRDDSSLFNGYEVTGIDMESTYTLDEIGKKFDLTRERIRQIEKKALEKLAKSDVGEVLKSFLE